MLIRTITHTPWVDIYIERNMCKMRLFDPSALSSFHNANNTMKNWGTTTRATNEKNQREQQTENKSREKIGNLYEMKIL